MPGGSVLPAGAAGPLGLNTCGANASLNPWWIGVERFSVFPTTETTSTVCPWGRWPVVGGPQSGRLNHLQLPSERYEVSSSWSICTMSPAADAPSFATGAEGGSLGTA